MAYVDQALKSQIATELKKVMPQGWKYSLAVNHHSTIVCTISAAPVELIKAHKATEYFKPESATHIEINPYHFESQLADTTLLADFTAILGALNTDNHNRSDIQTDYFDVGHYVSLNIGRWNKPFVCTAPVLEEVPA
jgi:hypothetical protein